MFNDKKRKVALTQETICRFLQLLKNYFFFLKINIGYLKATNAIRPIETKIFKFMERTLALMSVNIPKKNSLRTNDVYFF